MSKPRQEPGSPWSFKVATVAGIPVRIHFTFLLLLVWIGLLAYREESRVMALLLPAVFFCVVLHEFGHALVGRAFGVETRDITLYPIGGVAMLASRPKPKQELWIALAGPAVNVVIAGIVFALYFAVAGKPPSLQLGMQGKSFFDGLYAVNVALPIFNMIPAFPMDGGRVLRALLAMAMPEVKATQIAGAIGQVLAMGLGFYGLIEPNIVLVLIAFFVFVGAGQEVQSTLGLSLLSGKLVSDAMVTDFRTIESGANLGQASEMLLEGSQHAFPVQFGEEVLGLLTREDIIRGLSREGSGAYVAGHMSREFARLAPSDPLESALEVLAKAEHRPALVFEGDDLVGIMTAENLAEFMMVRKALQR
jgi:Zn-dependent protease/CBS domain-containing protein